MALDMLPLNGLVPRHFCEVARSKRQRAFAVPATQTVPYDSDPFLPYTLAASSLSNLAPAAFECPRFTNGRDTSTCLLALVRTSLD
jgi:hypothetical protein